MAKSRAIGFLISAIFHAFLITLIISTQFTVHWTQPENQDREVKLVVPIQNTGSNKILIPGFSALKSGDNIPVVAVPDSNRILKNDTRSTEPIITVDTIQADTTIGNPVFKYHSNKLPSRIPIFL
jgi:hypothetical protein